jgi:glutathione synthetase
MIHVNKGSAPQIKQVEFNTIASSFGGLSTRVSAIHRHLMQNEWYPPAESRTINDKTLPRNDTAVRLAEGISECHGLYQQQFKATGKVVVLFIVQANERNVFDQRILEEELGMLGIQVVRVVFDEILDRTSVLEDGSRALLYHPRHLDGKTYEVSIVYYRSGYTPDDYRTDRDWQARTQLEYSRAIKCPSVLTQLAGMKKVQQVLATPGSSEVERYLSSKDAASKIRQTFVRMYPLDDTEAGKEGQKIATDPALARQYVLKPQREGGGNNIYRENIIEYLNSKPRHEWDAYILMEMIEPPPQRNAILRNGEVQTGGVICELGVFGVAIWNRGEQNMLRSSSDGFLLRTKGDQSEEGGVAAGFGALDSPCLVADGDVTST